MRDRALRRRERMEKLSFVRFGGSTGLERAASRVTGRRSKQLNSPPLSIIPYLPMDAPLCPTLPDNSGKLLRQARVEPGIQVAVERAMRKCDCRQSTRPPLRGH